MRYWSFEGGFGFENLRLCEGRSPAPGPRDVLIGMAVVSLNYRDLVVLRGQHGKAVQPPLIPLSDGVGVVLETGADVTTLAVGDRVSPCFYQNWMGGAPPADLEAGRLGGPLDGVLTTHRVIPASAVVRVPDHLSNAEAATLPCAGVTAWSALNTPAPVRAGETVLILGTGGVALIALQLANAMGARTIVTTSSADKAKQIRAMGADLVIDRTEMPDWSRAVRQATDGTGCDRVLELSGAATLNDSVKAARTGGVVVLIGNVTGNDAQLFLPLVLTRQLTLQSVSVGSRQSFVQMNRAIDYHQIRPVVGKTFDFEEAPVAFRALESHSEFGNICISIA